MVSLVQRTPEADLRSTVPFPRPHRMRAAGTDWGASSSSTVPVVAFAPQRATQVRGAPGIAERQERRRSTKGIGFAAALISSKGHAMPACASESPVCPVKTLEGLLLLVLGIQLAAPSLDGGSTWLTIVGVLLTASGLVLPATEVIRRHQSRLP